MTILELQEMLERTPKTGAMNKATRRVLLAKIYALMIEEEERKNSASATEP